MLLRIKLLVQFFRRNFVNIKLQFSWVETNAKVMPLKETVLIQTLKIWIIVN